MSTRIAGEDLRITATQSWAISRAVFALVTLSVGIGAGIFVGIKFGFSLEFLAELGGLTSSLASLAFLSVQVPYAGLPRHVPSEPKIIARDYRRYRYDLALAGITASMSGLVSMAMWVALDCYDFTFPIAISGIVLVVMIGVAYEAFAKYHIDG